MSLTDDLIAESASAKACISGRWFDTLTDSDRAEADAWLSNGGTKAALLRVARARGYTGSSAMFYAHTLGDCPCPRRTEHGNRRRSGRPAARP